MERPYHPSDRSSYSHRSTSLYDDGGGGGASSSSSAAPSSASRASSSGRSRVGGGFGEVKSPSIAPASSSSSGGGGAAGGGIGGVANKSLDEHISAKNTRAAISVSAASLYEILDIASLDKGRADTWASSDWCAEARKSREYLRKAGGGGGGRGGLDDVPPRSSYVGDGLEGRGGKRTDDGDDDGRGGGYPCRYNDKDDTPRDRRSSSRGRMLAAAERKEEDDIRIDGIKSKVERDRIKNGIDGSVSGRSQYRGSASLPVRRHDEDDDEDDDDDDDNGTFRTVSRGGRMDHDAAPPSTAASDSGRAQSNGRGSEFYRIPQRGQHPQQEQRRYQPDQCRPSPSRSPSPMSRSRGSEYQIPHGQTLPQQQRPDQRRPFSRSPSPASKSRGSEYRIPHRQPRSQQQQQPVQRRPSSRSHSRGSPPNSESRNNNGITRSRSSGRPLRSSTPGRRNDPSVRSSTSSAPGRSNDQPLPSRSATPGRSDDQQQQQPAQRRPLSRSHSRGPPPNAESRNNNGITRSSSSGRPLRSSTPGRSNDRPLRSATPGRNNDQPVRYGTPGRTLFSEERSQRRDPPMGSWDGRSSRQEADQHQGQGRRHQQEEPRRRSPSRSGRTARSPPRDPSIERRTPSLRGDNAPLDRSPPRRLSTGRGSDRSPTRGKQSQSVHDRYDGKTTPSSRIERSLSSSRHEDEQRLHQRGGQQQHHPVDAIDDSQSTTNSSKQPIKSSPSTRKSSKKHISSKATVVSALSYSSSATPETGPLTSSSGKSSKGSFLKSRISSFGGVGGRMPPSTPPQNDDADSRPATPNRFPSVEDDSTKGSAVDDVEIVTCLFDRKGYCIRHPMVQLRKKKFLGGWNVMMNNCPECCMEEMRRLKTVSKRMTKSVAYVDGAGRKNNGGSGNEKGTKSKKKAPRGVPDLEQKEHSSDRSPVGRSSSRSRRSRKETLDATDATKSARKSKSKSRQGRRDTPSRDIAGNNAPRIFEFDIPLDAHGGLASSHSPAPRSIKSHKSTVSKKSKQSGKSTKTNKSAKSARTNKSTRTSKTSTSIRGRGSSVKRETIGRSSSSKRETRGRSSSSTRDKGKSGVGKSRSVSRESRPRSAQRISRQGTKLCVSKMPFKDQYNREGSYTGEVNENGQPNGKGILKYKNDMDFVGKWKDGHSEEMDMIMKKPKNGFSNWKASTMVGKMEREKRNEQEVDECRFSIDHGVRSGSSTVGSGIRSQQGTSIHSGTRAQPTNDDGEGQQRGRVSGMKWSDVNGFSGRYSGEMNSQNIPDGRGLMKYSNGVVEEGVFCNGVFQPPTTGPLPPYSSHGGENGGMPSSSISVWSLKSSPTMAFGQASHSVSAGHHDCGNSGMGASSVRGAPSSIHVGGPSGL